QAYRSRTTYGGAQPQAPTSDEPDTRGHQDDAPKKVNFLVKWFKASVRYIENYKAQIFWIMLFYWVSLWIFVERAYYFAEEREHISLRRITGFGVAITRG
uniref:hypothetical protein n=1 Tax=Salmonella sp. s51228 TaxID=3159652 RepID=UPI0039808241